MSDPPPTHQHSFAPVDQSVWFVPPPDRGVTHIDSSSHLSSGRHTPLPRPLRTRGRVRRARSTASYSTYPFPLPFDDPGCRSQTNTYPGCHLEAQPQAHRHLHHRRHSPHIQQRRVPTNSTSTPDTDRSHINRHDRPTAPHTWPTYRHARLLNTDTDRTHEHQHQPHKPTPTPHTGSAAEHEATLRAP